jgi:hypothetical protein
LEDGYRLSAVIFPLHSFWKSLTNLGNQPKASAFMKVIQQKILVATSCLLFMFAMPTFAIEGLQLSVQSSNVFLSWPSVDDGSETYLVQYRQTLRATDSWQTLTDYFPAAPDTNITFFVHSNIVQYPQVELGGGGDISPDSSSGSGSALMAAPSMPMVMPANGSGDATPLAIYPPGFDFSSFVIFDPTTGEWVSGKGYSVSPSSAKSVPDGGFEPMDDDSGSTNVNTGFYRVVRDGAHIYGLTNGMVLSGTMNFPIEMALDSTDQIAGLTFYADGNPLIGASGQTNAGSAWQLNWDTTMMPNGTHNISAEVDFDTDDPVTSLPVSVTVSNGISFPNYFTRVFGSQMWIYAESTSPDSDYEIDMYDESSNSLGSFYGTTDDGGVISFLWDLTDGNGNTLTNESFSGVFTIQSGGSQGMVQNNMQAGNAGSPAFAKLSAKKSGGIHPDGAGLSLNGGQAWVKESDWSHSADNFVVAYGPLDSNSTTTYYISQMMIGGPDGEYGGAVSALNNQGLGGYTLSPGNAYASSAFQMSDVASKAQLLSYLADPNYRNFYWFGHGSSSSIGYNGTYINTLDVAFALVNTPLNYSILKVWSHPYRFVFLDGCQTGAGKFSEAFGIPAQTVDNAFFGLMDVRSRAFLGFKNNVYFNSSQWDWYSLMIGTFFSLWRDGDTLSDCVYNATQYPVEPMSPSWVIYGATDLQRGGP